MTLDSADSGSWRWRSRCCWRRPEPGVPATAACDRRGRGGAGWWAAMAACDAGDSGRVMGGESGGSGEDGCALISQQFVTEQPCLLESGADDVLAQATG